MNPTIALEEIYAPIESAIQAIPDVTLGILATPNPLAQEVYNYFEDISRSERLPVKFTWDGDEVLIQPV